jgi:hypothetical protein
MHAIVLLSHIFVILGGYNLMSVPTLRGDNYTEWRKKVDLTFVCAEVDWVVDTPQPVNPIELVRYAKDDDADWDKNKKGSCSTGDGVYPRETKVGQCK